MRKTILLLLALVSGSASAEWVKLASGGNDADTLYTDPAAIRKAGKSVRVWSLVDHRQALADSFGKSHMSEKVQWEYDCKEEKRRMLTYATFPEHLGQGKAVYSDSDPGKWEAVSPGADRESIWKLVCGKK